MKPFLVVQASGRARVGDVVSTSSPLQESNDCFCVRPGDGRVLYRQSMSGVALGRCDRRAIDRFVSRCAVEQFGPLVEQLTRVLATVDPYSLVSRGAPLNEFESEAETILLGLRGRSLRHVEQVIDAEFIHWFGASMRLRPEERRRIARGLLELLPARLRFSGNFLHRYGPASGRTEHVRAQPMN